MNKIIAVDFDDVCVDLLSSWVAWLDKKHNLSIRTEDITDWEMKHFFPELTSDEIYFPLTLSSFWKTVKPKPGAYEYLRKLKETNRVVIVTSTYYRDLKGKFDKCLLYNFDFLTPSDVIISFQKDLINCDYLIDDSIKNLASSYATCILFDMPHNKKVCTDWYDKRVYSWKEIYDFIENKE